MSNFKNFTDSLKSAVNNVADMAKDIASTAGDKAKDLASAAGDKAKEISRRAKISVELSGERDNMEKAYTEIGRLYYEMNKEEPGEFFIQLFDQVKFAGEHIADLEAELAALRAEDDDDCFSFENVVSFDEAAAENESSIEVEITVTEETGEEEPSAPSAPEETPTTGEYKAPETPEE